MTSDWVVRTKWKMMLMNFFLKVDEVGIRSLVLDCYVYFVLELYVANGRRAFTTGIESLDVGIHKL
jgi:hypothetical protein